RRTTIGAGAAVLGLVMVLGLIAPSQAEPGQLDVAFGVGGQRTMDLGGTYDWGYATAVQPDGRILAAGVTNSRGTYDFAVSRYLTDGALDPSFGDNGVTVTDFGGSKDWAYALALQPDGRVVVAGVSDRSGSQDFALARYDGTGHLDPSFGQGGLVVTPVRPLTTDVVHGLAIQPDGKIVAAGVTYDDTVSLRPHGDFMVVRYTPQGELDPAFGVGGVTTTNFEGESYDEPYAVVLQPDGRIVLGGSSNTGGGIGRIMGADNLALARYLPNGLIDPSFGNGGTVVVDAGAMQESIRALALQPDGGIVAAGRTNGEKRGDMLVARFLTNGALDPSFGGSQAGISVDDLGTAEEGLSAVALTPDGTIIAGGVVAPRPNGDLAVMRYDSRGRLDRSFGHQGMATADFGNRDDRLRGIALQPDGKVVAVGSSETDFALARFDVVAR
ncbi:MAG TPA: delta-60 repeat domain-containing protein, partial [Acidimicrobiia bacterium]|nr:delta-60 repeat domain-containing protein [Acidimicrobiia bacterium]